MNSIAVGGREEGKTTLALWLARQSHQQVFVFDPRGIFQGTVVHDPEQLEAAIAEYSQVREEKQTAATRKVLETPIIYRIDEKAPEDAFEEMAGVLFPPQFTRGGFALIIDEAGELQGPNTINPALRRAVAQHPTEKTPGRDPVDRVHIIQTSHRLAEYHGKLKTCLNDLYMFRTRNRRDLEAIVDFTGEPELTEVVSELPKHVLVHYTFARQEDGVPQWTIWEDPAVWYTPLGVEGAASSDHPQAVEAS